MVFELAEHQRERRAELIRDLREEGGLGAVNFGQGYGPICLAALTIWPPEDAHGRWRPVDVLDTKA
jgi:hypothetical protein